MSKSRVLLLLNQGYGSATGARCLLLAACYGVAVVTDSQDITSHLMKIKMSCHESTSLGFHRLLACSAAL